MRRSTASPIPKTVARNSSIAIYPNIAAAAGRDRNIAVANHGNRSRTGRGSAQVLAALGVNVDANADAQAPCLPEARVCFCFAIPHHPAMRHAAGPRRSLGLPTILNPPGPPPTPAAATVTAAAASRHSTAVLIPPPKSILLPCLLLPTLFSLCRDGFSGW